MTEPADRAVLLLQKVSELLLESRAIVQQLEVVPEGESSADAADRIAYGILVAALEEGLVNTIRHVVEERIRSGRPGRPEPSRPARRTPAVAPASVRSDSCHGVSLVPSARDVARDVTGS